MSTHIDATRDERAIEQTAWRLDPARSDVEFAVPSFWGLRTDRGRFERYEGTLDLRRDPAIELTIEAASVATGNARRDAHLRSDAFLDAERHPQVRFVSDRATLAGEKLTVTGTLHAGAGSRPLELVATVRPVGGELEIEAAAEVDQRQLGMTLRLLGAVGSPTRMRVRGTLVPAQ